MPADRLLQLGELHGELIGALDRRQAMRRALALLAAGSEVAWIAWPDVTGMSCELRCLSEVQGRAEPECNDFTTL